MNISWWADMLLATTDILFINLENLKANKLAAGRHKDLNDLENLP